MGNFTYYSVFFIYNGRNLVINKIPYYKLKINFNLINNNLNKT